MGEKQSVKQKGASVNRNSRPAMMPLSGRRRKDILAGKEVVNREVNGKALIMQLFREHEIPVP